MRKRNLWTEEEIDILKNCWKTTTGNQLAALIPRHSRDSIYKKIRKTGIVLSDKDRSWRAKYAQSFVDSKNICKVDQSFTLNDLDNVTLQILLGSMLGDGSCNKQSENLKNHRFYEGHGLKQTNYVKWKADKLSLFKPRICFRKKSTEMVTLTHPIFTSIRNKFYLPNKGRKSIIPLKLLDKLDFLGFMIWYLDDGNLKKSSWCMSIGAKGWDHEGLINLVQMLNDKFNLSAYVYVSKNNQVVKIPSRDKRILDDWHSLALEVNIPKCLHYKFSKVDK